MKKMFLFGCILASALLMESLGTASTNELTFPITMYRSSAEPIYSTNAFQPFLLFVDPNYQKLIFPTNSSDIWSTEWVLTRDLLYFIFRDINPGIHTSDSIDFYISNRRAVGYPGK